ncbi:VanW family protein [Bacillus sp. 31A1R]|uniref:VanW family protein n=1 Tax=Robertmurraya mangrovi TaxID=3098077 RepID=A0ABU5IWP7_9BACI|nr:VanW family protein [Bacillus sp. 31A1R]MDZ5471575.1 VanW family protein [Bacillus sp. 31A1R]
MKFIWVIGLLLLTQQTVGTGQLTIKEKEDTLAVVDKKEFLLPIPGSEVINQDKYLRFLDQIEAKVYEPAVNAKINHNGAFISEKVGHKLYKEKFTELFLTSMFRQDTSIISVPTLPVHPRVDRDLLAQIRVKQIGQYVTYFNNHNQTRSHNINLATEAINNHVIFPGETFSFNKVVGKRTVKKGYMRAPVIVRGELSEDIGGGICQVSSTLFNAVDRAGVKILQRYSHSKRVPYVPPGRDATVSWYGPDFTFQNNYSQPILILARKYGGSVNIRLFSSDDIEFEPRKVPSASKKLPEEVPIDSTEIKETAN